MFNELFTSNPFWSTLGLSLAHFLWEGAAIAILLAVGLLLLRHRSPNLRHGLCLLGLTLMAICPAVTLSIIQRDPPALLIIAVAQNTQAVDRSVSIIVAPKNEIEQPVAMLADASNRPNDTPAPAFKTAATKATTARASVAPTETQNRGARLAWGFSLAALAWAGCVAFLILRFVVAWLKLRRLRKDTEPLPSAIQRIADRLLEQMRIRMIIPIRASRAIAEPIAFGLIKPLVLLPASLLTQCPIELIEAMIAHELAHIRRYDLWINLFQRAVETLLFYHPAVWWVSSRMRLERELCCDDLAIQATGKRADYADALLELARTLHGWSTPMLTAGMFTSRLSIVTRVRRVLQMPATQHDPNRGRYWITGPVTLALAATLVLAASIHRGLAESKAVAQSSATQPSSITANDAAPSIPKDEVSVFLDHVALSDALSAIGKSIHASLITVQLSEIDLKKPITYQANALEMEQFLVELNEQQLFDRNYWAILQNNQLMVRPLSEWYRHVEPTHVFMTPEAYRAAKLPKYEIAQVVYSPRVWTPSALANIASDQVPINSARAVPTMDEKRVLLTGFCPYIDRQLELMTKWDHEPAPAEDALSTTNAAWISPSKSGALYRTAATQPTGESSQRLLIRPLIDGVVVDVPVKPGQKVKKGDLLVQLDDAEAKLELEAAKAKLNVIAQRADFLKQATATGTVTAAERRQYDSDLIVAEVEVKKLGLRIERSQIRSPADGTVGQQTHDFFDFGWSNKAVKAGEAMFGFYIDTPPTTKTLGLNKEEVSNKPAPK